MNRHLAALLLLACVGCLLTAPLLFHLSTAIIGAGVGDNVTGVWNVWWVRTALQGQGSLFSTAAIFAPIGTSLVLHSLAPLVSVAVVLATPRADAVTTYNLALFGCVILNLWVTYALAWTTTRDHVAGVFAGIAFAAAPILLVRVYGHLNLAAAWVLPLLLLTVTRFEDRPNWRRATSVSVSLAALAYTDYYYAIFGAVAAVVHVMISRVPWSLKAARMTRRRRDAIVVVAGAIATLTILVGWVAATGGTTMEIAGRKVSLHGTFNLRVTIGLLLVAAILIWKQPVFVRTTADKPSTWRLPAYAGGLAILLMGPLVAAAFRMWLAGDYVSPVYLWRNAPQGVDVATVVLGNPMSLLTGSWTTAAYDALGIDGVEGVGWLSVASIAMAVVALRRVPTERSVRALAWIGVLFFTWSLGPYLQAFGQNTGIMLPQTLLRFIPVAANARIPGRAFIVVALVVAVLGAAGLASMRRSGRRWLVLVTLALLAVDVWPRPHSLVEVPRPAIYDRLRDAAPGVVLELPTGFRDGFGDRGRLDHWSLAYQVQHGHPVVGGFVARLSSRVRDVYEGDPVLRPLLDASEGSASTFRATACHDSVACSIRYIVLNRRTASPALVGLAQQAFAMRETDRDAERTIFAVEEVRACTCDGGAVSSKPR